MLICADVAYPGKQSVADDDEIIAGEQKMSLKCPVSFVGIIGIIQNEVSFTWRI